MDFEIWRSWTRLIFLEPSAWEYVLLALEFLLALGILLASRRSLLDLDVRRSLVLVGCIAALFVSERLLVLDFPGRNLLPAPDIASAPLEPFAPLLGMLPLVVAGAWLGPGPGFLVGLAKGILRVGMTTGSVAAPFHLGLFGFLVGFLLRQDYQGRLALLSRQPVAAVLLMTPFASLFMLLATFAQVAEFGLSGLDYAMTLTGSYFGPMLVEGFAAALLIQSVYFLAPQHRPVRIARRLPPYSRTLNRRLLFFFVPLMVLMTGVLVYAVTATALRLATSEAVHHMARDANSAAEGILSFIQTGQSLLREFVSDERLGQTDEEVLEARLRRDLRLIVFFDQLLLLDADGRPLALYPPQATGAPELTAEEQVLLERGIQSGAPQISSPHRSREDDVVLSFLAPVIDPAEMEQDGLALRVLVGRTRPNANLILAHILEGLQWSNARGTGFIVNSQGRVVAHPNPDMLLMPWTTDEGLPRIDSGLPGWAYESRDPQDNTRQLVYYLPVHGYPWGVVIRLPYDVVLKQARQIATPLLVLQILLGGGLVVIISLVTNWVTQPLKELAAAADRIADGDLSRPVDIGAPAARGGQDEVARVGLAFEDMRVRLRDRMEDLSLLLAVSQSVSATLELAEGMPFILEGALQAAEAPFP
ncbi:MAG: HAMP domain-containing protein, partial [Anaerolineae bacterium]|nr:HAMP domain-containing protein [Anaerolineae bacterium]